MRGGLRIIAGLALAGATASADPSAPPAPPAPADPAPLMAPPVQATPAAPTAPPGPPVPARRTAILSIFVNERRVGDQIVYLEDADVLVPAEALRKAGLLAHGKLADLDGVPYVALASLPVTVKVDEERMTLRVTAGPDDLEARTIDLGASRRPGGLVYRDASSLYLNYGFHTLDARFDGFAETGLRRGPVFAYASATMIGGAAPVRGLTSVALDRRSNLSRWVAGDLVVNAGTLGGGAVIEGLHLVRSFELDPYLVTTPSIDMTTTVLVPSTAQIYVNGVLVRTEALAPGRVALANLPVTNGSGDTRVVLTDALGRQTELVQSYYLPGGLLRPGFSAYHVAVGAIREHVGLASFDYGAAVAVARYQRGLTPLVTAGLRADTTTDQRGMGASITVGVPVGQVDAAMGISTDRGAHGAAASLAWSYTTPRGSIALFGQYVSGHYATVDVDRDLDRVVREGRAQATLALAPRLAIGAQLTGIQLRDGGWSDRTSVQTSSAHSHGITLSVSVGRNAGSAQRTSYDAMVGLGVMLSPRTRASVTHEQHGADARDQVELHHSLGGREPGIGYRALAEVGDVTRVAGVIQAQTGFGRYDAGYTYDERRGQSVELSAAGGLALIGGRLFASPPIDGSFALVRVPGVAGVAALLENHVLARTDAHGDAFIPNLQPYYGNNISIRAADLPFDRSLPATHQLVAPPAGGGLVVTFLAPELHLVRGTLRVDLPAGPAVPSYGELTVTGGATPFVSPVGKDGEFELDGLMTGRHAASIVWEGGRCAFELVVPDVHAPIIDTGAVACKGTP